MPQEPSGKPITITLGPEWRAALEYFQQNADTNHMPVAEQVRRALLCYWMRQPAPHGIATLNFVLDDYQPGDEEFGLVSEP